MYSSLALISLLAPIHTFSIVQRPYDATTLKSIEFFSKKFQQKITFFFKNGLMPVLCWLKIELIPFSFSRCKR